MAVDRKGTGPVDEHNTTLPQELPVEYRSCGDRDAQSARDKILEAGREIFTTLSYSDITDLRIYKRAGVTRGALQHHFGDKFGLFVAIVENLQRALCARMSEAINGRQHDPWENARAGTTAFLNGCSEPTYQAVVLEQGPAVVGWDRWRELDNNQYGPLIRALTDMLIPARDDEYARAMAAVAIRGALTELAFEIARSSDRALARDAALAVVDDLLIGVQRMTSNTNRPPARIGIGQLRAATSAYLDRVQAGETFDVLRRGRAVARLQPYPVQD
ncbi:TetR family transcriptional regulator [Mycobacterium sp. 050134]|uniref:TetR family transcriptional regulator n=1 Tax=Mycobacterium sp. 050134 TaxID=3096111 RepID=UPI002ED90755